jgi:signal transduction histidine kinase
MQLSQLLEQAGRPAFDDPNLEAAYREDRRERNAVRTRRVLLVLMGLATLLGVIIVAVSHHRHLPLPPAWVVLRFGVIIPILALGWFLAGRPWGKARLQGLLGYGLPLAVGAYAIEWTLEWNPAIPLRALWAIPGFCLWAVEMTLPMSPRAVVQATVGVCVITVLGIIALVPQLDRGMIAAMVVAYAASGGGLVLFARWRERDHREVFLHRREAQLLAERLKAQNETLIHLNQLRDDFIAGILHDLRSPLTRVFLASGLLQRTPGLPEEEQARLLAEIVQSAKRIDFFATHFLEQRSLESSGTTPQLATVSLDGAVQSVLTRAQLQAGAKSQTLTLDTVTAGALVLADELLLDRALSNLLDNAVKFSPIGAAITVRVGAEPDGRMRLAVIDTGPGLSAAEQARLFQPYTRLENRTTMGEPSTGLGLSLVKSWVEAMGGAVGCESEPGRGSTFWLTVPRAPAS